MVNNAEETMRKVILIIWGLTINLFVILIFQECMAGVVIEEIHKDTEGKSSTVLRYFSEDKFRKNFALRYNFL